MRKFALILFISLIMINATQAEDVNIFYLETVNAHSRIDGQTYQWESSREFLLKDFQINENQTSVNMNMLDNSQNGRITSINEPFLLANFEVNVTKHENGTLKHAEWDLYYMRKAEGGSFPLIGSDYKVLVNTQGHKRYDLKSDITFFSVNLEYFEYMEDETGELQKLRVNTELSTNNYEDGTIIRTSIHIIKRTMDAEVIFEYSRSVQEVNDIAKTLNWLDQPSLYTPYQLLLIAVIIYIYIKIHRFLSKKEIKIISKE